MQKPMRRYTEPYVIRKRKIKGQQVYTLNVKYYFILNLFQLLKGSSKDKPAAVESSISNGNIQYSDFENAQSKPTKHVPLKGEPLKKYLLRTAYSSPETNNIVINKPVIKVVTTTTTIYYEL